MNATSHLPLALALTLAACGGTTTSTTPPNDLGGGGADLAMPAGDDGGAGNYYLPAGYALVPFLSDVAIHDFTAADPVLVAGKDYRAVIETDVGRMVLDLYEKDAPITVNSFVFLALNHYFDGIAFHRVIDGFMAQTGDPNTLESNRANWGTGGPGYYFGLEVMNGYQYDSDGVAGMARTSNPNTNGSQFFITFAAQHSLDNQYTIFGKLAEGLNVLPKIARGMPPAKPTVMQKVYIVVK